MNETLFKIILALIPILGAIITYFIIPYIRTLMSTEKLEQYKEWASLAVKCAEMLFTKQGMGADKKAYVVDFLNNMFNKNGTLISEQQIEILIEAAVNELNKTE